MSSKYYGNVVGSILIVSFSGINRLCVAGGVHSASVDLKLKWMP